MPASMESLEQLRAFLQALPNVVGRPLFGNEAFFLGAARFAELSDRLVLVRLPPTALTEALRGRYARPIVSAGATSRNGWVEIPVDAVPSVTLEQHLRQAYEAAKHSHRPAHRRSHARRVRRSPSGGAA